MKSYKYKAAVTLLEMLIVVSIVAVLTMIAMGIASHIDNRAKSRLVEDTFALINAALDEFRDYGYSYKHEDYRDFIFPLDCTDYPFEDPADFDIRKTLIDALGAADVSIAGGTHDEQYSGSEILYFFLSRVPANRTTLEKLDGSLITSKDSDGQPMKLTITFSAGDVEEYQYPLLRIIDPWGQTIRYDYYDETETFSFNRRQKTRRNFPLIISAGPDKEFDTPDDITGR